MIKEIKKHYKYTKRYFKISKKRCKFLKKLKNLLKIIFYNNVFVVASLVLIPFIFIWLLKFIYGIVPGSEIGDKAYWITFSGSYLGVIGAVSAVWWQIKKERENENLKKLEKELNGVITFLIIFRETCENQANFYYKLNQSFSENQILNNMSLVEEKDYCLNKELFYKFISDIEIEDRNHCIELLFFFERVSYKNKDLYSYNFFRNLSNFYDEVSKQTNNILIKYEKIKKNNKNNYYFIISKKVHKDLHNIIDKLNLFLDKCLENN